jgi:hypothetical protein
MADTKTSDEASATVLTGAELVRVTQSSTSKKTTAGLLGHQFRGCRLERTTNLTGQNFTTATDITFQQATLDTDGFWSAGTPTRATIPAAKGFKVANISVTVRVDNSTSGTYNNLLLVHRNSGGTGLRTSGVTIEAADGGGVTATRYLNATMLCCPVTAGDYFTVQITQETDTSVDLAASGTSLSIEITGMEP